MAKDFKKKWLGRLSEIEERLCAWNEEYARVFRAVVKEEGHSKLFRRMTDSQREAVGEKAKRRVGSEPLSEASAFFDELCDHFLSEPLPGERARVRAGIGNHPTVFSMFWSYVAGTPGRVTGAEAQTELERGLAAVAIDDFSTRFDDINEVLGQLWVSAANAGCDPQESFEKVAELANPGAAGGGAHMSGVLLEFGRSEYFASHVAPLLSVAGRRAS